jgi:hypothetical protein
MMTLLGLLSHDEIIFGAIGCFAFQFSNWIWIMHGFLFFPLPFFPGFFFFFAGSDARVETLKSQVFWAAWMGQARQQFDFGKQSRK